MANLNVLAKRTNPNPPGPVTSTTTTADTVVIPVGSVGDASLVGNTTAPLSLVTAGGTVSLYVSTSNPETSITAAPGAFCFNPSTGVFYSKSTGVGNTGWTQGLTAPASAVSPTVILQSGNTLGAAVTVGSTDAFDLQLEANSVVGATIGSAAGAIGLLTAARAFSIAATAVADKPAGGAIGTAAATVDVASCFQVTQSTASQTLTLPSPTSTTAGRLALVLNTGSVAFTMLGASIAVGAGILAAYSSGLAGWVAVGGAGSSTPYNATFNAAGDWGAAAGGLYTITVTAATHGKGTVPGAVQVFETSGSDNDQVQPARLRVASTGDVSFSVSSSPDARFAGRVVIA